MGVPHGIVVLDKPVGITSRDAVDHACKRLKTREIGHCGTLDPLATGVLVLVIGRARRLQELLAKSRKVYTARIRLGATSVTDDAEGPISVREPPPVPPAEELVRTAAARFIGEIEQRPPRYSAVKVAGERLYDLARRGEGIDAPMRKVRVYDLQVTAYRWPDVEMTVTSAGGTYVRSIARDLGEMLGTGGHLAQLARTESGGFKQSEATTLDALGPEHVLPLENALLHFPRIDIAAAQAVRLGNGAVVRAEVPVQSLISNEPLFGWVGGKAVALLANAGPQRVRSQRLLITLPELEQLAEQEFAAGQQSNGSGGGSGASYSDGERR